MRQMQEDHDSVRRDRGLARKKAAAPLRNAHEQAPGNTRAELVGRFEF